MARSRGHTRTAWRHHLSGRQTCRVRHPTTRDRSRRVHIGSAHRPEVWNEHCQPARRRNERHLRTIAFMRKPGSGSEPRTTRISAHSPRTQAQTYTRTHTRKHTRAQRNLIALRHDAPRCDEAMRTVLRTAVCVWLAGINEGLVVRAWRCSWRGCTSRRASSATPLLVGRPGARANWRMQCLVAGTHARTRARKRGAGRPGDRSKPRR
jgi:hypothetical protein